MMSRLRHPNIIHLACVFEPYVCLVLELATKGSLRALLLDTKKSGFESMLLDVARGLHYLHSAFEAPIAHRDIKPDNVRAMACVRVCRVWRVVSPNPSYTSGARERGLRGQARRLWGVEGRGRRGEYVDGRDTHVSVSCARGPLWREMFSYSIFSHTRRMQGPRDLSR
jgi:hypothetical protein